MACYSFGHMTANLTRHVKLLISRSRHRNVILFTACPNVHVIQDARPLIGNVGRLPWRMSRETLRCQVPEAM